MGICVEQKEMTKRMRTIQFFSRIIHSYGIQVSLVYGVIIKLFNTKLKSEKRQEILYGHAPFYNHQDLQHDEYLHP